MTFFVLLCQVPYHQSWLRMLQSLIKSITVYLLWAAQDTGDSEFVAEQQRFARLQKLYEARYATENGLLLPMH